MNGYTKGARNEIFALKPAPIQVKRSVSLFVCLSVSLSVFVYLSVSLSLCLSVSACLRITVSVCLCVHLSVFTHIRTCKYIMCACTRTCIFVYIVHV